VLAAAVIVLAILLKIVLRLTEIPGTSAIEATVTSAATRAYSIMSWPRVSLQISSLDVVARRLQSNQPEDTNLSVSLNTTVFFLDLRVANFAQVVNRTLKRVYLRLMLKNGLARASGKYSSRFNLVLDLA
jgi:hypothetical protein